MSSKATSFAYSSDRGHLEQGAVDSSWHYLDRARAGRHIHVDPDDQVHWDEVEDWDERIPMRPTLRRNHGEWENLAEVEGEREAREAAERAAAEAKALEAYERGVRETQAALDRRRDAERAREARIQDMARRHHRPPAPKRTPKQVAWPDAGLTSLDPPSGEDTPPPAPKPKRVRCTCKHLMRDHGPRGCEEDNPKLYGNGWKVTPCPCDRTPDQVLAAVS